MRVFISWSGQQSKDVALVLRDWVPQVIQQAEPFVSSEDIDKGARWNSEIADKLGKSDYGIICVTRANQAAPWLNFEAGAIGKTAQGRVACLLIDLPASDVTGPLSAFQHTLPTQEDIKKLMWTIARAADTKLTERVVHKAVDAYWRELQDAFDTAEMKADLDQLQVARPQRSDTDMLSELVDLTRDMHKLLATERPVERSYDDRLRNVHRQLKSKLNSEYTVLSIDGEEILIAVTDVVPAPVRRQIEDALRRLGFSVRWDLQPSFFDEDPIEGKL